MKPQSITRKKDTRHAVALDSENNNVSMKDIVKVIDGPHSVSASRNYCISLGLFQQSLPPRGGRHFKEILMGVGCP